jgi:hypothetical protein
LVPGKQFLQKSMSSYDVSKKETTTGASMKVKHRINTGLTKLNEHM